MCELELLLQKGARLTVKLTKKLDHLKEKFQNIKIGMCDYLKAVGYLFAQWG